MYLENRLLSIYVEENLHAGTGRGLGAVDLPIQRERTTDFPMIQASGIKGKFRAECDPDNKVNYPNPLASDVFNALFGDVENKYAGSVSFSDASILLFPVRSLNGVYAWTTSPEALARLERTFARLGWPVNGFAGIKNEFDTLAVDEALVASNNCSLIINRREPNPKSWIVLEEYSFTPRLSNFTEALAALIVKLFPDGDEYDYFKDQLPKRLCVLHNDAYRDFVRYATEVQTHNRLIRDTKTVKEGGLWNSESLPADTLLYSPLLMAPPRTEVNTLDETKRTAVGLVGEFERFFNENLKRLQLGGDETTGQGFVALKLLNQGEL